MMTFKKTNKKMSLNSDDDKEIYKEIRILYFLMKFFLITYYRDLKSRYIDDVFFIFVFLKISHFCQWNKQRGNSACCLWQVS